MKPAERLAHARSLGPGPELDAMFFEVCWKATQSRDDPRLTLVPTAKGTMVIGRGDTPVTLDANSCEAWVMHWAKEHRWLWSCGTCDASDNPDECWAEFEKYEADGKLYDIIEYAPSYKHALTLAAIAAQLAMEERNG